VSARTFHGCQILRPTSLVLIATAPVYPFGIATEKLHAKTTLPADHTAPSSAAIRAPPSAAPAREPIDPDPDDSALPANRRLKVVIQ
jgi:hypothetical protein